MLAAYAKSRRLDVLGGLGFTDFLVRVFSNDIPPLRHARGLGLMALELFPPLKHFVARRMIFGARG
jgi:2-octaprenyl-6-methoxyphenol hydroxylase